MAFVASMSASNNMLRRFPLLAILLLIPFVSGICENVTKVEYVTFSKTNPVDGSLWIAVPGNGLVRVGRNQKAFAYSSSKGDFPCDTICNIAFDNEGVLWITDSREDTYSYSSLNGFVRSAEVSAAVKSALAEEPCGVVPVTRSEPEFKPESKPESDGAKSSGLVVCLVIIVLLLAALCFALSALFKARKAPSATSSSQPSNGVVDSSVNKAVASPSQSLETVSSIESLDEPQPLSKAASMGNVSKTNVAKTEVDSSSIKFREDVLKYVSENFSNPEFSVEDIADHFGFSRVHLNRKLKAAGEDSPVALIKTARMQKASELLKDGGKQIAEISAECGFASATYFSSAFKEYFGISPKDFLAENHSL